MSDALVNFTDLFATLGDLLELDLATTYPGAAQDSVSFLPVLLDPSIRQARPAMINGRHAIREGNWKLISTQKNEDAASIEASRFELYNLADDLAEQHDVSENHPERTTRLFKVYRTFAESRKLK